MGSHRRLAWGSAFAGRSCGSELDVAAEARTGGRASRDADGYVIVASKGGAPTHPAWYHNLLAHPAVTVEVGGETFEARARVTEGAERDRLFAQRAAANPNFAEYQRRTTSVIHVVVLERLG